jgi:DNA-binding NarL/FixJ family response regulator
VQEALTNVRRHAPGRSATITISGGPGTGLSIEARNRIPADHADALDLPGTGTGLVGLTERASLAGGHLEHARTTHGEFRLSAWLPFLVVADVADGAGVGAAVRRHAPDVILMDIRMPGVDGIAATRQARARPDPPEVIVMTTFDTDEHLLRALHAGASGFLLKDTPPADIVAAIHRVAAGDPILSPGATRRLMAHVAQADRQPRRDSARRRIDQLTERERQVATAVGRGASNADIAADLHISVATAKTRVSRIRQVRAHQPGPARPAGQRRRALTGASPKSHRSSGHDVVDQQDDLISASRLGRAGRRGPARRGLPDPAPAAQRPPACRQRVRAGRPRPADADRRRLGDGGQ